MSRSSHTSTSWRVYHLFASVQLCCSSLELLLLSFELFGRICLLSSRASIRWRLHRLRADRRWLNVGSWRVDHTGWYDSCWFLQQQQNTTPNYHHKFFHFQPEPTKSARTETTFCCANGLYSSREFWVIWAFWVARCIAGSFKEKPRDSALDQPIAEWTSDIGDKSGTANGLSPKFWSDIFQFQVPVDFQVEQQVKSSDRFSCKKCLIWNQVNSHRDQVGKHEQKERGRRVAWQESISCNPSESQKVRILLAPVIQESTKVGNFHFGATCVS